MAKTERELTVPERRSIRKLVTGSCANYDRDYGCLPLDCECPMLGICYTNSAMCRYFREAVLPNDPELEAALQALPTKRCQHCGKPFPVSGRRVYCSDKCADDARKKACGSAKGNQNRQSRCADDTGHRGNGQEKCPHRKYFSYPAGV